MLTAKELKEKFEYRNGILYNKKYLNTPSEREAGTIACSGKNAANKYRRITIKKKVYYAHRLIWLYHYGEWPKDQIDHINKDTLDNHIENLRIATQSQNSQNLKTPSHNLSGLKGAHYQNQNGKYRSRIVVNGKRYHLGCFDTPEEAHKAYCKAADEQFGEFANHGS